MLKICQIQDACITIEILRRDWLFYSRPHNASNQYRPCAQLGSFDLGFWRQLRRGNGGIDAAVTFSLLRYCAFERTTVSFWSENSARRRFVISYSLGSRIFVSNLPKYMYMTEREYVLRPGRSESGSVHKIWFYRATRWDADLKHLASDLYIYSIYMSMDHLSRICVFSIYIYPFSLSWICVFSVYSILFLSPYIYPFYLKNIYFLSIYIYPFSLKNISFLYIYIYLFILSHEYMNMCSLSIRFRFSLYIYIHPLSKICVFSLSINISILSHRYVFSLHSISFVLYIFILLSQEYMFPLKFKTITSRKYSQHAKQFCSSSL